MKISYSAVALLFLLATCAQSQPYHATNAAATYQIVSSGADQNVWQQTLYVTNGAGKVSVRIHKYSEVGTGMNFEQNGEWVKSKEEIDASPDGSASATNGQHQAYFPGNLYEGTINLVMPDGRLLQSRPIGLSYDDGTNVVMLAELTNSIGRLLGNNQTIYTNAFRGIKADVVYTYKKSGFEQDIILRQQPPTPESLGLNPDTAKLQVLTEFFDPPQPVVNTNSLPDQAGISLPDQALDFGSMRMVPGRAFLIGTNSSTDNAWVGKQWMNIEGRTILVEEVPVDAVASQLSNLPLTAKAGTSASKYLASHTRLLPAKRLAVVEHKSAPMQIARLEKNSPGLVLDYNTIIANTTDYTFKGDTTYYINGSYWLFGTTILEGGAVLKCSSTNSINPIISCFGNFDCQTAPYRPAIFTTIDDDTVGETIPGSTGSPTMSTNWTGAIGYSANYYWISNSAPFLAHDCQVRYLTTGIGVTDFGTTPHSTNEIRDCQFYSVNTPIAINGNISYPMQMNVRNVLIENAYQAFYIWNLQNLSVENATFHHAYVLRLANYAASPLQLTNCLFICVTNIGLYNDDTNTASYQNCATNSSDVGVFQSAGAGSHYLATNSIYRGVGTTNIDPNLLTNLRQKTTYPPLVYSNTTISTPTNFSHKTQVDTNANPDIGYHYTRVDYALSQCSVTNTTLTVSNGVVVASYGQSGLQLINGGQLVSIGTPLSPNYFVRGVSVQEQPYSGTNGIMADASATASALFRFTKFTCPAVGGYDLYDVAVSIFGSLDVQHCEFWGGANDLSGSTNSTIALIKNNLFWRSSLFASNTSAQASLFLTNNTFWGTTVTLKQPGGGLWSAFNNNFDSSTVTGTLTNGFNAYLNDSGRLSPTNSHDVVSSSSLAYQPGLLGGFYLPSICSLANAGNTNADLLGLYQFTTETNQAKDGNSIVNIGYHYVAVDSYGNAIDTNSNGIPDYLEDVNGNGLVDPSENDWIVAILSQPTNQLVTEGSNLTMNVTAAGMAPISYQWYFNSLPIIDATNASLALTNAQAYDEGYYYIVVTSGTHAIRSSSFYLRIFRRPVLSTVLRGVNGTVYALALDSNDILYAGGDFFQAGDTNAEHVAMWDPGTQIWSPLQNPGLYNGDGVSGWFDGLAGGTYYDGGVVKCIAIGGSGKIYVGGNFKTPGFNIASWDPPTENWTNLDGGLFIPDNYFADVNSMAIVGGGTNGTGATNGTIYATGFFSKAGGISVTNMAAWDIAASTWSNVGTPPVGVPNSIVVDGTNFYVGGTTVAKGYLSGGVINWHIMDTNLYGNIKAVAVTPSGRIFIGGQFRSDKFLPPFQNWALAEWNTVSNAFVGVPGWNEGYGLTIYPGGMSRLGYYIDDVNALCPVGTNLIVGGQFFVNLPVISPTISALNIVGLKLNNNTWFALTPGNGVFGEMVNALAANGPIYAGGNFISIGDNECADNVGWWDPSSPAWNPMSNHLPSVAITSPADGASFTATANITINAAASDDCGISKVDFYQGTSLLGTDTASPYSYTWNGVTAGSYSLSTVATDNDGATKTSSVVNVIVH